MTARVRRVALVAVAPTAMDVALFAYLRQERDWPLVAANVTAILLASLLSYALHRLVTFRSDPYVRWVHMPAAFAVVAVLAGLIDTAVLGGLAAADDLGTTRSLLTAKAAAVAVAAIVRLLLYRAVLLTVVRRAIHERGSRGAAPGQVRATLVVPALDERDRIGGTIQAAREGLAELAADGGLEIVVVDDGSSDGTAEAALAAGADQVVVLPQNRGKGAAVRSGVSAARGRTIAFTDADLSYSPDQVAAVIGLVEAGWDVAVGNRRHPDAEELSGPGALRHMGSRLINLVAGAVLLSHPRDTQCGLKAFRSDVAHDVFGLCRIDGFAFDIEVLHLVERHELSLAEVPVRVRSADRSTVRAARDGMRLLRDLWRIRRWSAAGAYELPERSRATTDEDGARVGRSLG